MIAEVMTGKFSSPFGPVSASLASLIVAPFGVPSEFGSRVFGSRSIARPLSAVAPPFELKLFWLTVVPVAPSSTRPGPPLLNTRLRENTTLLPV